jgi:hypothetical protein
MSLNSELASAKSPRSAAQSEQLCSLTGGNRNPRLARVPRKYAQSVHYSAAWVNWVEGASDAGYGHH